jgi:hypothetical protein
MAFRFVAWLRTIVILLSAQFLLGIWVNLFGTVPSTAGFEKALLYTGDPVLTAHMLLAVVIVVIGFVVAVASFGREVSRPFRWLLVGGLLSVLWSYEWGVQLIDSGYSSGLDSFWMAVGFIAAMAFYGVAQAMLVEGTAGPTPGRLPADRQ